MPIYISRGKFTTDAVKGMLAKPENREEAVANLFKSCGGKLIGWYLTFGRHDWLVIGEFPDEKSAASAVLAAAAGGSLSDVETTLAMTAKDAAATFEAAGKAARGFRSAGQLIRSRKTFARVALSSVLSARGAIRVDFEMRSTGDQSSSRRVRGRQEDRGVGHVHAYHLGSDRSPANGMALRQRTRRRHPCGVM